LGVKVASVTPIWETVRDRRKAILSPLVSSFKCSCCEDRDHCVRVDIAGYSEFLEEATMEEG
jgi:hypothetical protein